VWARADRADGLSAEWGRRRRREGVGVGQAAADRDEQDSHLAGQGPTGGPGATRWTQGRGKGPPPAVGGALEVFDVLGAICSVSQGFHTHVFIIRFSL